MILSRQYETAKYTIKIKIGRILNLPYDTYEIKNIYNFVNLFFYTFVCEINIQNISLK